MRPWPSFRTLDDNSIRAAGTAIALGIDAELRFRIARLQRGGSMKIPQVDYDTTPFLIIWETTQACDLACRHCRASAQPNHDPRELTTAEGESVLDQAAFMGTPIFVLSGGDPLKRPDLYPLIRHGADRGLRMATIPAATPLLTEEVVRRLKESGLSQMALSL